jgi:hypothetical protein
MSSRKASSLQELDERQGFRTLVCLLIVAVVMMTGTPLYAQEDAISTNTPRTKLEAFARQTGLIVLKSVSNVGSVTVQRGTVSVFCVVYSTASNGRRELGLNIRINTSGGHVFSALVDDDEIEPLQAALKTIRKVEKQAVPLPSYEVYYRTRDELRFAAFNNIDGATEELWARLSMPGCFNLTLTLNQLAQLETLIAQAKVRLDSVRTKS